MKKALKTNCSVTSPQQDRHVSLPCRLFLSPPPQVDKILSRLLRLSKHIGRSTTDLKPRHDLSRRRELLERIVNKTPAPACHDPACRTRGMVRTCVRSHVRCRVRRGQEVSRLSGGSGWTGGRAWMHMSGTRGSREIVCPPSCAFFLFYRVS